MSETALQLSRRANESVVSSQSYDDAAIATNGPAILVISNGSRWAGDEPASFDDLLAVLRETPLDPTFEGYGNFVSLPRRDDGTKMLPDGWLSVWGNFLTISHVFHIVTNDVGAIREVGRAIKANKLRADYLAAKRRRARK